MRTHKRKIREAVTVKTAADGPFSLTAVVPAQLRNNPGPQLTDPRNFKSKRQGNDRPNWHQTTRIGNQNDVPYLQPFIRIARTNAWIIIQTWPKGKELQPPMHHARALTKMMLPNQMKKRFLLMISEVRF